LTLQKRVNSGYAKCSFILMRRIKLSGRELAVLKALGFADAVLGRQLQEHTQIPPDDITDVLNALLAAGYVESKPYREQITPAEMWTTEFEVNPGYVHELRSSMQRSWV
jgi:DNA-binding MarR family transcriptional regulator